MAVEPANIGTELEDTDRADAFEAQIDAYLSHRAETGHRRYAVPLDALPRRVVQVTLANRYCDADWASVEWPEAPPQVVLVAERACDHDCAACK